MMGKLVLKDGILKVYIEEINKQGSGCWLEVFFMKVWIIVFWWLQLLVCLKRLGFSFGRKCF